MKIDSLSLENFRNYNSLLLSFDSDCNVIYGENAQGKTNLLEAIHYLACGKSYRAHSDKEVIHFDCNHAKIIGNVYARERDFETCIELYTNKRKKISINDVSVKSSTALSENFHTVFFSPDDLMLIREGALERRKFMDQSLCQLRPKYAKALSDYTKLLENKNRILKDAEEYPKLLDTLPEYNERMAVSGSIMIHYRSLFCKKLNEYANNIHFECSGSRENLSLKYETVKTVEDPFASLDCIKEQLVAHQQEHYLAEIYSKSCLSGPHKDDISVFINDYSAKQFASQGQIRTASLSLKLAEREIHKNTFGEYPVLLLDDVLSELDPKRQEFVLNKIIGGQLFITCCENDRLNQLLKGRVFHIQKGLVIE